MNLREIEDSLDRLQNELRACRQHGIQEFVRQAERCRQRAAQLQDPCERAIWCAAADKLDHGAELAREKLEC